MAKTKKTIQLKNLAKYDVLIEDTSSTSVYFQINNLPSQFTGGKNSFLIAGSSLLEPGSNVQIEIVDANGLPVFQNPVQKYIQGNSRLVSVEITETTAVGFANIIIMGKAKVTPDGNPVPADWKNKYNVRWIKRILVAPNLKSLSQLVLESQPTITVEEKRLYSNATASYISETTKFTASLSPTLYSGFQIGYLIKAESPTTFSADYDTAYITGSLKINNTTSDVYLPITDILNETTAFSTGKLIQTAEGNIVDKIYLYSGSYSAKVFAVDSNLTSSTELIYNKASIDNVKIPISYAKLRVANLNTVSGEIYKLKVYNKAATNTSDYKLIADVPLVTSELLVTESIRGDLPIGDFNISPTASQNWYSDRLETSSNAVYTISGSSAYYNPSIPVVPYTLSVGDKILLRSVKAHVPIFNNQQYAGYVSASGYFIGTKRPIRLFPTTEYTLQLDAVYNKTSGSANLTGIPPEVDIYLIGTNGTKIIDNNPLGQKIGTLTVQSGAESQWFRDVQFNFNPAIAESGDISVRLVIKNGFWYFSELSVKPASDNIFAPDEVQFLVPNYEHYNELLQYKIEFFDINNNSTEVSAVSIPTFFTGSNIDLGTLP